MDTITLERQEVLNLLAGIEQVSPLLKSVSFRLVYACKRTRDSVQAEVDAMNEAKKPTEEFLAYDRARDLLCREYAKQEAGEPKLIQMPDGRTAYDMDPARTEKFGAALATLRSVHAPAIEAEAERVTGLTAWLREEVFVQVHRVSTADFPTTDCTLQQLMWLLPMLRDNAESEAALPA